MILIQVIPKEVPQTREGILWVFVCVLIVFIGSLVLYIRKMHIKHTAERKEDKKEIVGVLSGVVQKNTEAFYEMKGAVHDISVATTNAAEASRDQNREMNQTLKNINDNILRSTNKRNE